MSWHPLTLALWLTELASWGIYLGAARRLFMVIPTWSPESHSAGQLRRERAMELTIYQGKWVFALQVVILGLLLAGLCKAWPDQIPGAMCGTGVLQAMTPYGWQTLSYRMIALLVLFCCHVVAAIDRTSPEGPATQLHGRLLLVAGPFLGLATLTWVRSTAEVGAAAPVSCCAVLYDRIGAGGAVAVAAGGLLSGRAWLMIAVALCLTAAGWGARLRHRPLLTGKRNMVLVAAGTLLWLYAVRQAVLHGVAPYVFQVLHHPCPWCLFLVEHDMMGVLLFGPPLLVLFEITAILTASVLRDAYPALAEPALARVRRAGSRLVVFMLFFTCAATAPVFNWWVRFGGWMDK